MDPLHRQMLKSLARRGDMYAEGMATAEAGLDLPAWTDLKGSVAEGIGNAVLTYEGFRDTNFKLYFMRYDQADELNFEFQLPHEWDPTTAVKPHIHIVPMANPVSTQVFALTVLYTWVHYGAVIPALTGWTSLPVAHNVNPGDAFKSTIISLGTVNPPEGSIESDILLMQVKRNTTVDTYETPKDAPGQGAANVGILSVDIHYQRAKMGTQNEFPSHAP